MILDWKAVQVFVDLVCFLILDIATGDNKLRSVGFAIIQASTECAITGPNRHHL
jgi:hypothetical protein